jgi:hypothetical protein
MAKESPTMTVAVDNSSDASQAIGNDVTNLTIATPRGVADVTGVNSAAVERLLLLADGSIGLNGVFNDATNLSHAVLSSASATSQNRGVIIVMSGQTMTMETVLPDYALTRATDGSLTWSTTLQQSSTTGPAWT